MKCNIKLHIETKLRNFKIYKMIQNIHRLKLTELYIRNIIKHLLIYRVRVLFHLYINSLNYIYMYLKK